MDLGIFADDRFSLVSLTDAVNKVARVHTPLGESGLFAEEPIATLTVAIERQDSSLALIPTGTRGSAGVAGSGATRSVKSFATTNLKITDVIVADDLQNVRAFGSANELETVAMVVDRRLANDALRHDLTLEYQRAGALQGKLLDANGTTVLVDYFAEYGLTRPAASVNLAADKVRGSTTAAKDLGEEAASDAVVTGFTAFCGSIFYDKLINSAAVQEWLKHSNAEALLDNEGDVFSFNGVRWQRYRGSVAGTPFIPASEAVLVPQTAAPILKTVFGPADYVETANTLGLPRYAKQWPTDNSGRSVTLETQSQTLSFPTRPESLVKLTIAA